MQSRLPFAEEWAAAIQDMGRFPIVPPSEDVYVGDVCAFAAPPDFDSASELRTAVTPRWDSLQVLAQLDAEHRQRPAWNRTGGEADDVELLFHAGRAPVRHRIVGLRSMANLTLGDADLEPFLPIEIAPLIEGAATPERLGVTLQAGEAESYSLSVETLTDQLIDAANDGEGTRYTLKQKHLRNLPLAADPKTGNAYLAVVAEVLYIRSIEATIRQRRMPPGDAEAVADEPGTGAQEDPMLAAIRRAEAMNQALAESDIEDRIGGAIKFVTVTDDALTLRRSWPYPLAVAVRGVTLEVDVSTGEVVRMGPLGVELPALASAPQQQEVEGEESEVLEARRRGAEEEAPALDELLGARLYWDYGPRFDALDGELSIVLGGRLHLDAATFSEDDEIVAAFGEPNSGGKVRRAFLELGGAYRQLDFNLWVNFSELDQFNPISDDFDLDSVDFRNVFVGMRGIPVVGSVRVGYFKEPFGLEETTSSNDITFMERSLTDAFVERRNLGVMFQRRFTEERRMTAALGVFRDADNELNTGDGHGVSARVTGAPILAEDGRRALHFGAAATYRATTDDTLRFLSRPESAQAQVMADTGKFAADREVRVGVEAGTVLGSLSLQTEAVVAASNATGDPVFWSTYFMGSYVLTGEHRSYRERVGAFGSVHPTGPFWWKGPGAVEVAGRYSYLDLDSGGIDGGALHDFTLGLNWYANDHSRVMLNYIAAHPEGFGVEHILQARLQLTF